MGIGRSGNKSDLREDSIDDQVGWTVMLVDGVMTEEPIAELGTGDMLEEPSMSTVDEEWDVDNFGVFSPFVSFWKPDWICLMAWLAVPRDFVNFSFGL